MYFVHKPSTAIKQKVTEWFCSSVENHQRFLYLIQHKKLYNVILYFMNYSKPKERPVVLHIGQIYDNLSYIVNRSVHQNVTYMIFSQVGQTLIIISVKSSTQLSPPYGKYVFL